MQDSSMAQLQKSRIGFMHGRARILGVTGYDDGTTVNTAKSRSVLKDRSSNGNRPMSRDAEQQATYRQRPRYAAASLVIHK